MRINENPEPTRGDKIYVRRVKTWVEVTKEQYYAYYRSIWATRKRAQAHGQCMCPKSKLRLCDGDCLTCEFHSAGDTLSLDYIAENEDGNACPLLDNLADPAPSVEEIICDKAELEQLFARLNELMPEAIEIGRLRRDGLTDEAIARIIGIKRTTFLSRLKKAGEQLTAEYPDLF